MTKKSDRGRVTIEIGGKNRLFQWKMSEICSLENRMGKVSIASLLSEEKMGFTLLCETLFVGHLKQDNRLTINKVMEWLDEYEGDIGELYTIVFTAIQEAMPQARSEDEEQDEKKHLQAAI